MKIDNGVDNATKVRSDFHIMKETRNLSWRSQFELLNVKIGKPEAVDSAPSVIWRLLTDGTNDLGEMCHVQLYESANDVVVQSPSIAFRNFHHSCNSVLMDQSDLHFGPVVIFIQTVGDSEGVR